jgi:AraC-like DNA-binding protein
MIMTNTLEILKAAHKEGIEPSMELLYEKNQNIPGSIQYDIRRYYAQHPWVADDIGMLVYHVNEKKPSENFLELRYCTTGNYICIGKTCVVCGQLPTNNCKGQYQTVDVFNFYFSADFLRQFTQNVKLSSRKDELLAFKNPNSFTKSYPICGKSRVALEALLNHSYSDAMENIFITAKIHEILVYGLACAIEEREEETFTCKFLADERSKQQIHEAREILWQHIGDPLTIKELARKVAMNECYLKKGFKEVFGTTIFDFYQQLRMEHAKYLLHDKSFSVTDVSSMLGYSSISHFSAAFKKHTGLNPCDLLQ